MKRSLVLMLIAWLMVGWAPHGVCAVGVLFSQVRPTQSSRIALCPHCGAGAATGTRQLHPIPVPKTAACPSFPAKPNSASPCCEPFPGSGGLLGQDHLLPSTAAQFWAVNQFAGFSSAGLGWSSFEYWRWLATRPSFNGKPLFLRLCVLLI